MKMPIIDNDDADKARVALVKAEAGADRVIGSWGSYSSDARVAAVAVLAEVGKAYAMLARGD